MRLFVAVDIPDQVAASLATIQQRLRQEIATKRWQRCENMHVTLHFLGDVSEEYVPELQRDIDLVSSVVAPFRLAIGRFGVFPNPGRPQVLWLGLSGEQQVLQQTYRLLGNQFCRYAWLVQEKRPYTPHITLARGPFTGTFPLPLTEWNERLRPIPPLSWEVKEIHLYRSELLPQGAVYSVIHSGRLTGTADHIQEGDEA
ncbi:RNA 2',3'-cyclic phosphodiesterase [Brevibacillus humidisoli]|uniref:RNA 2',3'-cyclic phosphodiesterase n=1 Tax=Brevibacillus humidisoli TaxID=2895522 RepID=UPI001E39E346|nr:RNA 2',3'-cyclic phosphodiesterase [Brevibacillus humidisoli]UFJ41678.1 RNA 2',3'-cyclic phosphodiesterase [Brevibacillus humidisoli]